MKSNMGTLDRAVRFLLAAIIVGLYYINVVSGTVAIVLLVFAVVLILVGSPGFCPWYMPLGINTKSKTQKS